MSHTFYNNLTIIIAFPLTIIIESVIRVSNPQFSPTLDTRYKSILLQVNVTFIIPTRFQAAYRHVILTCVWHIIVSV